VITLAIDASTYIGSVAVLRDDAVLAEDTTAMKGAEREGLMPVVAAALARAGVAVTDVDRIVCGEGPGSFTSLRIAGGIAKGIATGVGCSLFAVPSLALLVGAANRPAGRYLATLDALRGEHYAALYEVDAVGQIDEIEPARLVASADVALLGERLGATVVGPAPTGPLARGVLHATRIIDGRGQVDLASWEPAYGRLAEAQVRWEAAHGRPLAGA
jgi:tRNA threonylcarbamoyladenosine biosynthesis protein TsaB